MTDKRPKVVSDASPPTGDMLARFQYTIEQSPEAVFWLELSGRFSYVNKQACLSLGYTRKELLDLYLWDIDPDFPKERWNKQWNDLKKLGRRTFETRHRRKDGRIFPVEVCACQVSFAEKEFHAAFVRDITARKQTEEQQARLEAQLEQARKLEAIGTLAGGIAHDFNNMLSVIIGYSELLKKRIPQENQAINNLLEIERAAHRSKDIIRQLIAFSRKQVISPVVLDMNNHIETTLEMLGRLIGENIDLQFCPANNLWRIRIDPSQLDQILINLAVNARDALPDTGGRLKITTTNVVLDGTDFHSNSESRAGDYTLLTVNDNGTGMDKETLSHVFEPFFTTKELGKGTGLGLATIYGIIKQNNCLIDLQSEPGQGSTFHIYFPRAEEDESGVVNDKQTATAAGSGKVMLVEDDEMVRTMVKSILESCGYSVIEISNPLTAIALFEKKDMDCDLVLSDIVMPEMSGLEMGEKIKVLQPTLKVLYMSGYSSKVKDKKGLLSKKINFIEKPFSKKALEEKIAGILQATGE